MTMMYNNALLQGQQLGCIDTDAGVNAVGYRMLRISLMNAINSTQLCDSTSTL